MTNLDGDFARFPGIPDPARAARLKSPHPAADLVQERR